MYLLLNGIGGVMREDNLSGGGVGNFRVVLGVVDEGCGVVFLSPFLLP